MRGRGWIDVCVTRMHWGGAGHSKGEGLNCQGGGAGKRG